MTKAITKYVRISPRKARLVANLIRGLSVFEAKQQLAGNHTKASRLIEKTLKSAVANAEENEELNPEDLFISEIRIDEGPHMKRAMACSRGRRNPILKRSSHFTIKLSEMEAS